MKCAKILIFLSFLMATSLLLPSLSNSLNESRVRVFIEDEEIFFTDAKPYIDNNNRTMVPLRFVAENLGAKVSWIDSTQTVNIEKDDTLISIKSEESSILVNGKIKIMDTNMVFNKAQGRNYVPLRFISENLGSSVDWNSKEQDLIISIKEKPALPTNKNINKKSDSGIYGISIGDSTDTLILTLGEPDRIDPTPYEYELWIFNQDIANYIQVGVKDSKIVSIYSNSKNWEYKDLHAGVSINQAKKTLKFENSISFKFDNADFTISLPDESPKEKLLAHINSENESFFIEVFIDIHNDNSITAVRFFDKEALLATGGYALSWSFSSDSPNFEPNPISDLEQQKVNRANEKQLLELINAIRYRKDLDTLSYHSDISDVALSHSKDMHENGFFAHTSPTTGGLIDRVNQAQISYKRIAENLAVGQADAVLAHQGLMNSYGHRLNIINPLYEALGTGAYYKYYTQKFITQ